jgi:hypothetical protein
MRRKGLSEIRQGRERVAWAKAGAMGFVAVREATVRGPGI